MRNITSMRFVTHLYDLLIFFLQGTRAGVAAGMNVVWIPDARLRQLDPDSTHGSSMILDSLVDFRPEEWGLPPYED